MIRNISRDLLKMRPTERFRYYVADTLVNKYHMDVTRVKSMVRGSSFNMMLRKDPGFVMHYSPDYWAEKVHDEFCIRR